MHRHYDRYFRLAGLVLLLVALMLPDSTARGGMLLVASGAKITGLALLLGRKRRPPCKECVGPRRNAREIADRLRPAFAALHAVDGSRKRRAVTLTVAAVAFVPLFMLSAALGIGGLPVQVAYAVALCAYVVVVEVHDSYRPWCASCRGERPPSGGAAPLASGAL